MHAIGYTVQQSHIPERWSDSAAPLCNSVSRRAMRNRGVRVPPPPTKKNKKNKERRKKKIEREERLLHRPLVAEEQWETEEFLRYR